jgi:hypothetical protein
MEIDDAISDLGGHVYSFFHAECDACGWVGEDSPDETPAVLELEDHMIHEHGAEPQGIL